MASSNMTFPGVLRQVPENHIRQKFPWLKPPANFDPPLSALLGWDPHTVNLDVLDEIQFLKPSKALQEKGSFTLSGRGSMGTLLHALFTQSPISDQFEYNRIKAEVANIRRRVVTPSVSFTIDEVESSRVSFMLVKKIVARARMYARDQFRESEKRKREAMESEATESEERKREERADVAASASALGDDSGASRSRQLGVEDERNPYIPQLIDIVMGLAEAASKVAIADNHGRHFRHLNFNQTLIAKLESELPRGITVSPLTRHIVEYAHCCLMMIINYHKRCRGDVWDKAKGQAERSYPLSAGDEVEAFKVGLASLPGVSNVEVLPYTAVSNETAPPLSSTEAKGSHPGDELVVVSFNDDRAWNDTRRIEDVMESNTPVGRYLSNMLRHSGASVFDGHHTQEAHPVLKLDTMSQNNDCPRDLRELEAHVMKLSGGRRWPSSELCEYHANTIRMRFNMRRKRLGLDVIQNDDADCERNAQSRQIFMDWDFWTTQHSEEILSMKEWLSAYERWCVRATIDPTDWLLTQGELRVLPHRKRQFYTIWRRTINPSQPTVLNRRLGVADDTPPQNELLTSIFNHTHKYGEKVSSSNPGYDDLMRTHPMNPHRYQVRLMEDSPYFTQKWAPTNDVGVGDDPLDAPWRLRAHQVIESTARGYGLQVYDVSWRVNQVDVVVRGVYNVTAAAEQAAMNITEPELIEAHPNIMQRWAAESDYEYGLADKRVRPADIIAQRHLTRRPRLSRRLDKVPKWDEFTPPYDAKIGVKYFHKAVVEALRDLEWDEEIQVLGQHEVRVFLFEQHEGFLMGQRMWNEFSGFPVKVSLSFPYTALDGTDGVEARNIPPLVKKHYRNVPFTWQRYVRSGRRRLFRVENTTYIPEQRKEVVGTLVGCTNTRALGLVTLNARSHAIEDDSSPPGGKVTFVPLTAVRMVRLLTRAELPRHMKAWPQLPFSDMLRIHRIRKEARRLRSLFCRGPSQIEMTHPKHFVDPHQPLMSDQPLDPNEEIQKKTKITVTPPHRRSPRDLAHNYREMMELLFDHMKVYNRDKRKPFFDSYRFWKPEYAELGYLDDHGWLNSTTIKLPVNETFDQELIKHILGEEVPGDLRTDVGYYENDDIGDLTLTDYKEGDIGITHDTPRQARLKNRVSFAEWKAWRDKQQGHPGTRFAKAYQASDDIYRIEEGDVVGVRAFEPLSPQRPLNDTSYRVNVTDLESIH
eukprot:GHVN01106084.1.p1 GENE.GHVN01106084.1~~GHVN01106084.1.p1  ORF type:complete len:1208 (+),score=216.03 GHVN01106084.1:744-4367(+)